MAETPEIKTSYHLLCPNGEIAERILTRGWSNANIDEVDEHGYVADYHSDDFPDMEMYGCCGAHVVSDGAGNDWLTEHCRVVTLLDEYTDIPADIAVELREKYAWPEHIVDACCAAYAASDGLEGVSYMLNLLPRGMAEEVTVKAAVDVILSGRLQDKLVAATAIIKAHRQHEEPITVKVDEWDAEAAA